jgi:hypothetical protein
MQFNFTIHGYGFYLCIGSYDLVMDAHTILAWGIMKKHILWRGERHTRYHGRYTYSCTKNGKEVERLTFQSPIVSHI